MIHQIEPLQHSELDEFISMRYTAFENSEYSLSPFFFPNGYSPSVHAFLRRGPEKDIYNPDHLFTLVRDAQSKEVVGGAEWEIRREPKTMASMLEDEARARAEREAMAAVEGVSLEAIGAFREAQARHHREIMQERPHVYLGVLVVYPQHQRRGVGQAALTWGLDKADELGLPAYLEATRAGKGLYERMGFKVAREFPMDAEVFESSDKCHHYCMVREAKAAHCT